MLVSKCTVQIILVKCSDVDETRIFIITMRIINFIFFLEKSRPHHQLPIRRHEAEIFPL